MQTKIFEEIQGNLKKSRATTTGQLRKWANKGLPRTGWFLSYMKAKLSTIVYKSIISRQSRVTNRRLV